MVTYLLIPIKRNGTFEIGRSKFVCVDN